MAYPDYSIVIVSVTQNGVTTDYSNAFYNEQLAKKFYENAISEGNRAFYYEKPLPSKFVRNDSQPLKVNTEQGQEKVAQASLNSGAPVPDGVEIEEIKIDISLTVQDSKHQNITVTKKGVLVGTKLYDTFLIGPQKFFKKAYRSTNYEPVGVIGVETRTNKRITFTHNGSGGYTHQVEKLWPNKDETEDTEGGPIIINIEGQDFTVGSRISRKTFGGNSAQDFKSEFVNSYINNGIIILETDFKVYWHDGEGWYVERDKPNTNQPCPNVGQVKHSMFLSDLVSPITKDDGLTSFVLVGYKWSDTIVDSECNDRDTEVDRYKPAGTKVDEDSTYDYFSDGQGSTTRTLKVVDDGSGGNDEDNGGPSIPPCPPEGTIIRREKKEGSEVYRTWGNDYYPKVYGFNPNDWTGGGGQYLSHWTVVNIVADGNCGEEEIEEGKEYTPSGTVFATVMGTGPFAGDYIIEWYVDGYEYNHRNIFKPHTDYPDGDPSPRGGDPSDPKVPDGPRPPLPPNEPCPPKGEYPYKGDSDFVKIGGSIVSSGSTVVERSGVLPQPFRWWKDIARTTQKFNTGVKWAGRKLHDGKCGDYPEPTGDSDFGHLTYPEGTAKKAGYFYSLGAVGDAPYEWAINWTDGTKTGAGVNDLNWYTARCTVYHDGKQNITIRAWKT